MRNDVYIMYIKVGSPYKSVNERNLYPPLSFLLVNLQHVVHSSFVFEICFIFLIYLFFFFFGQDKNSFRERESKEAKQMTIIIQLAVKT